MNQLNSILLEGVLVENPVLKGINEEAICTFKIANNRKEDETVVVQVQTRKRLAEVCNEYLKEGREIRAVGRICQEGERIFIEAEHVEFKSH